MKNIPETPILIGFSFDKVAKTQNGTRKHTHSKGFRGGVLCNNRVGIVTNSINPISTLIWSYSKATKHFK